MAKVLGRRKINVTPRMMPKPKQKTRPSIIRMRNSPYNRLRMRRRRVRWIELKFLDNEKKIIYVTFADYAKYKKK